MDSNTVKVKLKNFTIYKTVDKLKRAGFNHIQQNFNIKQTLNLLLI